MRPEDQPTLLIVDDDDIFRERLGMIFQDRQWTPYLAKDAESALVLAKKHEPEYAVIDLRMPGKSGLWLLSKLLEIDPQTRIVMLTGYGSIATAIESIKLGAKNYLTKPVDADTILQALSTDETPTQPISQTPSLARTEWEHIQRVLTDCDGNISEAARILKIHRRSLQRKLQKRPPKI